MKTLSEAIKDWMVNYKRNSIKPSSYARMEQALTAMERYSVALIAIDELCPDDLQRYVNELADDGYALSTIRKQMHLISGYITHANLNGIILRPIHKGVKLPSETVVKKHKKEVVTYTHEEQERLREVLWRDGHSAYMAALLMLETGMRIGELMALEWGDIDWTRRCVRINKTMVRIGDPKHSFVQRGAKSFSSNRTIPLSKEAIRILEFVLKRRSRVNEFVLNNSHGDHLTYEYVRWKIHRACEEADVPYYGMHVFRHTFATNCYEKGCDVKILSKLLGHADVTVTYNTYIHLYGDALEAMRLIVG